MEWKGKLINRMDCVFEKGSYFSNLCSFMIFFEVRKERSQNVVIEILLKYDGIISIVSLIKVEI